jgi:hypothetical protein
VKPLPLNLGYDPECTRGVLNALTVPVPELRAGGVMKCIICQEPATYPMCSDCSKSYDRAQSKDDGSILPALAWAAARAVACERGRVRAKARAAKANST